MEYTISQLAKLAGISSRTLRYYEEIGLLEPFYKKENGYRMYSVREVDTLQQIMFFRSFGMELDDIKKIIHSVEFNAETVLYSHLEKLEKEKEKIDRLIENVNRTLEYMKGEREMTDKEKFEAFKKNIVNKNEEKYGAEIRAKYGDATIDATNSKILDMSEIQWENIEQLTELLNNTLKEAVSTGNPAGETAHRACALHRQWIKHYWNFYSKEAHLGLCEMYTQDERFTRYYENIAPGCAQFLLEAMKNYLK